MSYVDTDEFGWDASFQRKRRHFGGGGGGQHFPKHWGESTGNSKRILEMSLSFYNQQWIQGLLAEPIPTFHPTSLGIAAK